MKKRAIAVLAALICIIMMMSSCGSIKEIKFSKLVKNQSYEADVVPTSAVIIDLEGVIYSNRDELVCFKKEKNISGSSLYVYNIYNMKTGTVVGTFEDNDTTVDGDTKVYEETSITLGHGEFIINKRIKKTGKYIAEETFSRSLYDSHGNLIDEEKSDGKNFYSKYANNFADGFTLFNGKIYKRENGILTLYKEVGHLTNLGYSTLKSCGNYFYTENMNYGNIKFLDSGFGITGTYSIPDDVGDTFFYGFDNGKLLIQYMLLSDPYSEDYDFLYEREKYDLVSVLIDCKDGSKKELDLDFLVGKIESTSAGTLAAVLYIEDKRINDNDLDLVILSDKGKIKASVNGYVPGKVVEYRKCADDRFVVENDAGEEYLINSSGDIFGLVTDAQIFNSFIFKNGKIYDFNLNMKYDIYSESVANHISLVDSIVYETFDGAIKMYVDGEVKILFENGSGKRISSIGAYGFMVMNRANMNDFEIYNGKGEILIETEKNWTSNFMISSEYDGMAIIKIYTDASSSSSYIKEEKFILIK